MDPETTRVALTPREMWECVRVVVNWLDLTPPFTVGQFHQALEKAMEVPHNIPPLKAGRGVHRIVTGQLDQGSRAPALGRRMASGNHEQQEEQCDSGEGETPGHAP